MYFSALSLVLLFASTICASPVHIERRLIIDGVDLPDGNKGNDVYMHSRPIRYEGVPFKGVPFDEEAKKLENKKDGITYIKINAKRADIRPMKVTIDHLGQDLIGWGWGIEISTHVTFVLEIKQQDEGKVKDFLALQVMTTLMAT